MPTDKKLSELNVQTLQDGTEFYVQRNNIEGKTTLSGIAAGHGHDMDVINETTLLKIMTSAERIKLGNISSDALSGTEGVPSITNKYVTDTDIRLTLTPSSDEKGALSGANNPSLTNPYATLEDLSSSFILIQGSVENESATTPGYITSSDVAEDNGTHNGTVYSSELSGGDGGISNNWSSVLPITIESNVKRTTITVTGFSTYSSPSNEEDSFTGKIVVDWDNSRINGFIMGIAGTGYAYQTCFRFTGTILAGDTDFTGVLQNGSYGSFGSDPQIRLNGTNKTIVRLPMIGKCRNVGFEIENQLY